MSRPDSKDPSYINSDYTRLKTVKECWKTLRKNTGIFGSPKTFRKTFSSLAKDTLGSTGKAIKLTGHTKDQTLDVFYYKTHKEEVIQNADKVALIFTNFGTPVRKFN
jgi:integrase